MAAQLFDRVDINIFKLIGDNIDLIGEVLNGFDVVKITNERFCGYLRGWALGPGIIDIGDKSNNSIGLNFMNNSLTLFEL